MQKSIPNQDPQMTQYFSTLPTFVQESIIQSGASFHNVEQMKSFVANLTQKSS